MKKNLRKKLLKRRNQRVRQSHYSYLESLNFFVFCPVNFIFFYFILSDSDKEEEEVNTHVENSKRAEDIKKYDEKLKENADLIDSFVYIKIISCLKNFFFQIYI